MAVVDSSMNIHNIDGIRYQDDFDNACNAALELLLRHIPK